MSTRTFRRNIALIANQVVDNVLQGTDFDYPPGNSTVTVAPTVAAGQDVQMNVSFGARRVAENAQVAVESTVGAGPRIPDNVVISDAARATERIQVGFAEQAGAVAVVTVLVEVNTPGL